MPFLALCGCGEDDENNDAAETFNGINAYRFYYADYPQGTSRFGQSNAAVYYEGNKVVKLTGGFMNMDQASGFSYFFDANAYKEISYSAATATIVNKLNSATLTVAEKKQIVYFLSDGKIDYKVKFDDEYPEHRDTIYYSYENNLLKSLETYNRRLIERRDIFYNAAADVDSIVTRNLDYDEHGVAYFDPQNKERKVRRFLNFDNMPNPFQRLMMFDETFHRSLSAHNYDKWEEFVYDYDGHEIGNSFEQWTFIRENGIINFAL